MTERGTPDPPVLKPGRYLLNTDAARRASDGEAAIGVVLNHPKDHSFKIFKDRIGPEKTIQSAEYKALIKGLEIALENGIDKIRVYLDNQLVVDQINDKAAVIRPHLKPLCEKALNLLKSFPDQRVYWVPRKRNTEADKLAREALNKNSGPI